MASVTVTVPRRSAQQQQQQQQQILLFLDLSAVDTRGILLPSPAASLYRGAPEEEEEAERMGGRAGSRSGARRSSQVTVHRDLGLAALSAGWSAGDRVTQGRTGVVRKQRHGPPRREAWSIFQQEDPRVRRERGEGHLFAQSAFAQDWCDACGRQVRSSALKCRNCSYTCHLECKGLVRLDCNQQDCKRPENPSPLRQSAALPRDKNATKAEEESCKSLSDQEVRDKIEEYNARVTENGMKLGDDGIYTGFIKVHLRLRRPVTVLEARPVAKAEDPERRTSFYLPPNAVKQLHISSTTTAGEVIQALLTKFMVLDNPRKFALYRQTRHDGQDLFQKLTISEKPLRLRLLAGPDPESLTFVLKENETGDVEWHAFSVPELQNFLTILEKEECERVKQVEKRYTLYRQRLQEALQEAQGKPG